jgi:hypothetical protein
MKTIIHVHQQVIRRNTREGTCEPPLIVRRGKQSTRARQIELRLLDGTVVARFLYCPDKPLACGARLWCELAAGVEAVPLP